jgi:hypothetical protein
MVDQSCSVLESLEKMQISRLYTVCSSAGQCRLIDWNCSAVFFKKRPAQGCLEVHRLGFSYGLKQTESEA